MTKYFSATVRSEFLLAAFLERHAGHFGVSDVLRAETVGELRRTGFTWTERPHTLCLAVDRKYIAQALENANVAGLVVHRRFADELAARGDKLAICCESPAELFYAMHNLGIHRSFSHEADGHREIADSAKIAGSAIVHDDVSIGEEVIVHDAVIILPGTVIGAGSEIHPGSTLGTAGFFSKRLFGKKTHITHFGGVSIGANCIVHAGSNISRSVNHDEQTRLEDNVHLGIGVNIGHDCRVGEDSDISARALLAGRVNVGRRCWIGAGALISNALTIGDDAQIRIGSVVVADVAPGAELSGNFALSHKRRLREYLSQ